MPSYSQMQLTPSDVNRPQRPSLQVPAGRHPHVTVGEHALSTATHSGGPGRHAAFRHPGAPPLVVHAVPMHVAPAASGSHGTLQQ